MFRKSSNIINITSVINKNDRYTLDFILWRIADAIHFWKVNLVTKANQMFIFREGCEIQDMKPL